MIGAGDGGLWINNLRWSRWKEGREERRQAGMQFVDTTEHGKAGRERIVSDRMQQEGKLEALETLWGEGSRKMEEDTEQPGWPARPECQGPG